MKPIQTIFLVVGLIMLLTGTMFAQAVGDYQSAANGNWNAAATWQKWNGSLWATASTPPTGNEVITIRATDTVAVNVAVTINDTLKNRGTMTADTNLTFASAGVYQHDRDAGTIPMAKWNTGSTMLLTGTTAVAPNNRNQNFYNMVFNTPGLSANLNMGLDSVTIGGNIRVVNTGASSRWYLTTAVANDSGIVTIVGDLIVEGGQFSSNGTGNANTVFRIHQSGNIVVTGGNFSISRGSQAGSGITRWYLHGGNFSMSNATTQNSNAAGAWFVFDKAGTQTLTLGSGNTLTALPIVVATGTTLNMGDSKLRGSGKFTLSAGAGLGTSNAGGLDSAIVITGAMTLDTSAQYLYSGTAKQITGVKLPVKVYSIVNSNTDTLVLSQATTIYGGLFLKAGIFDNTIAFDLGGVGYIRFQGGNLRFGVAVSVGEDHSTIPESFFVKQNFPNPFNPATTIVYGLPADDYVTARVYNMLGQEVATLFNGKQTAGTHHLKFDASHLPSGAYIYTVRSGEIEITKQMVLIK